MDETPGGAMETLAESECWRLLASAELGRLAVCAAGEVDIYPVNYALDGNAIVFRTAEGTKLVEVALSGRVAFEVDGFNAEAHQAWSVVVKGDAVQLDHFDDIYRAEGLVLVPWGPGEKSCFVRITPRRVTGRRFRILATRFGSGST
jgi:hypothetical protein